MKKKTFIFGLIATMTVSSMLGACGKADSASSGSQVVKIATCTPLSGSQAAIGESIKNGAQMALEERVEEFKKLNIDLKLAAQDDQADPKLGVSIAQKLIVDKDVLGVVGHFNSGVAIPASEIYKKENLSMVSPANTGVAVTERGLESVNRICTRDDVQGPAAADFALKNLGARTAFVIHDKTTYGQGVADEFKKTFETNGGNIVGYEGITAGESDFNGVLNKVSSVKPDVVYFGGIYPEGSLIIKQMKEKNIEAKFIGPDGMDSSEVVKIAGESAVGVYYTSMSADVTVTDAGKEWAKKYEAKLGKAPENWSIYGYDAMNVMLDGIKKAIEDNDGKKPSREQVVKSVRAIKGFEGVATKVTFNSKGDNEDAVMYVCQFKEAKYPSTVVKSIKAKDYLK
ncbi:branched chain amino acid ABC transporter substrate-binding protein [Clostridium polyendosporum]|uniref:Branched chain amino acid ABC transporter substrate-binding protein n=1 Tax=Clostridium polyendosporum TaxID=69208 RepID=A0A919RXC5_9CLOT|nr:branched-chain amino acid ABC transporter substrate-binding protein [Clostridium polyendosporum]GIM28012.1 branched chain amino acid ABC transporter substrate-binding protein [Clostridium polyendosporum]